VVKHQKCGLKNRDFGGVGGVNHVYDEQWRMLLPKHKKAITSFIVVSCRCCGNFGAERLGEWTEEEGEGDESPKK
jgi:hypothetical protein